MFAEDDVIQPSHRVQTEQMILLSRDRYPVEAVPFACDSNVLTTPSGVEDNKLFILRSDMLTVLEAYSFDSGNPDDEKVVVSCEDDSRYSESVLCFARSLADLMITNALMVWRKVLTSTTSSDVVLSLAPSLDLTIKTWTVRRNLVGNYIGRPTFRPTPFCPKLFIQSFSSNPNLIGLDEKWAHELYYRC